MTGAGRTVPGSVLRTGSALTGPGGSPAPPSTHTAAGSSLSVPSPSRTSTSCLESSPAHSEGDRVIRSNNNVNYKINSSCGQNRTTASKDRESGFMRNSSSLVMDHFKGLFNYYHESLLGFVVR